MPLYLCALKNIQSLGSDFTEKISKISGRNDFTYLKKEKRLAYISVPELDSPYLYSERKIFHFADSIVDYFFWRDKLDWLLGYDTRFNRKNRPFILLHDLLDTLFEHKCGVLSSEFREWDALIEHESGADITLYAKFKTLLSALDFAKESGALWYFECDEEDIDKYLQTKKHHSLQTI